MEWVFGACVELGETPVTKLESEVRDWILGFRGYAQIRRSRLELGISERWHPDDLTSGTFRGSDECRIEARGVDGRYLVHLSHRDRGDPAIIWHTVITFRDLGGDTSEYIHGVARSLPRGLVAPPATGAPRVYRNIIELAAGRVSPRDAVIVRPQQLAADDVSRFVSHVLLDRSRRLPVVVVAPADQHFLVDPQKLAQLLLGQAQVAVLLDKDGTFALTDSLVERGLTRKHTCFDGAFRLYLPGMVAGESPFRHRLWFKHDIEEFGPSPEARLAGQVAERTAPAVLPDGFLTVVDEFDRRERSRQAAVLLASKPPEAGDRVADAALANENERLRDALRTTTKDLDDLLEEHQKTCSDLNEQRSRAEEADDENRQRKYDLDQLEDRAQHLRRELDARKREQVDAMPDQVRDDIASILAEQTNLASVLRTVAASYPARLVVLETAHKSADESGKFQRPQEALRLLVKLAGPYFDILQRGGGDAEARKVFGLHDFAATESESAAGNSRARALRTFVVDDIPIEMWSHLKIGVKPSVAETWRCHFQWMPAKRKIVIGWCGRHLDLR